MKFFLYLILKLVFLRYFPCLDFSRFLHVITNKYTVLNQNVSFLLQILRLDPYLSPGASRQFTAGGPGRTRTNRDRIRVRSYIPGSATDQAQFGVQIDHGMSR